jgi:dTDP-4-dehydrorhamnose reductase
MALRILDIGLSPGFLRFLNLSWLANGWIRRFYVVFPYAVSMSRLGRLGKSGAEQRKNEMNGPILVFGARGQVGRELVALSTARGVPVIGLSRQDADITNEITVRAALDVHRPAVVVNAAGYTSIDRAEREQELAAAANVTGPAVLAAACAATGIPLIHLSCDHVFNGTKKSAYVENDKIAPLNVYGRTKAEGEAKVRELLPRHVILRTSWIYGPHGRNFLRNVLKLAAERDELRMVGDQIGCPTATVDLAEAIIVVARKLATEAKASGTFHFAGNGATSWYGLASEIVQRQTIFTGRTPRVVEIKLAEYSTSAKRALNCELDSARFRTVFGFAASPWKFRVAEVVAAVIATANRKAAAAAAVAAATAAAASVPVAVPASNGVRDQNPTGGRPILT